MNGPPRLREGPGPSQRLLRAAELDVPSAASRRRALAYTSAAATLAATGTAAAMGTSALAKSVLLCVCMGTVGGGVMALAASQLSAPREPSSAVVAPAAAPSRANAATPITGTPSYAPEPAPPADPAAVAATPAPERAKASGPAEGGQPKAPKIEPWVPSLQATPAAPGADSRAKPSLFEELRIIESARAAVGRGDVGSALILLDGYDRAYAGGQFRPESLALRVQALSLRGDANAARALASEFRRRYPRHPLLSNVQAAGGE